MIVPADGVTVELKELVISENSSLGILMYILEALGLLISLASALLFLLNSRSSIIRTASPPFCYTFILGSVFMYISGSFFVGRMTDAGCQLQMYLQLLGYVFMFASMIMKSYRMHYLFNRKNQYVRINAVRTRVMMFYLALLVLFELVSSRYRFSILYWQTIPNFTALLPLLFLFFFFFRCY
jgi:hypothetical protein